MLITLSFFALTMIDEKKRLREKRKVEEELAWWLFSSRPVQDGTQLRKC